MGDKETILDNLDTDLSKEEEDIVDSIINELNDEEPQEQPQQRPPPQQMPPGQMPPGMMPPGQMPPGMMPPGMMPPGMMPPGQMPSEKTNEPSMIDKLKSDLKDPLIVSIISLIFMLPQSNSIITGMNIGFLLSHDGSLNMYGLLIKAIIVGIIYFLVKKYV